MNKDIYNIIKNHHLHLVSLKKIKKVYLIKDKNNSYIIKLNTNNSDIYKYLISKGFNYFPRNYNFLNENYDLLEYIPSLKVENEEKVCDYLKILAVLHSKTSYKREIDLDEIKEKYEELFKRIKYLQKYYYELNNKIDKELFMSPSEYLLIKNISLFYSILNILEERLNELYDVIKNKKSIRVSLLHNNLSLEHLIINEREYLISWDKAYFNNPIYELDDFYRKFYQYITIDDFFNIYTGINKLSIIEEGVLLILLSIPKELKITSNTYLDTKYFSKEIIYLKNVYDLLLLKKNK